MRLFFAIIIRLPDGRRPPHWGWAQRVYHSRFTLQHAAEQVQSGNVTVSEVAIVVPVARNWLCLPLLLIFLFLALNTLRAASTCDLLVQGAIDQELQPLLAALQDKEAVHIGAWTYWAGKIGKKSVVVSRTEVGPINAAASTALGIQRFHPAAIVNQGTAGAHNPELALWDIVVGEHTTDYSAFRSEHADEGGGIDPSRWRPLTHKLRLDNLNLSEFPSFPGDPRLVAAALAMKYNRGKVVKGNIGSAFQFNRELDRIKWLRRTYHIDTEDMESAFSAGVAAGMKVPFVAIRIVSDSEWHHPAFETIAGEYCAKYTLEFIQSLR